MNARLPALAGWFAIAAAAAVLNPVLLDGYSPMLGDQFDPFDWNGSLSAGPSRFGQVLLPTLAGALVWDLGRPYLTGDISVAAVPEPQTCVLMVLGLLAVAVRRRDSTDAQRLPEILRIHH